LIPTVKKWKVEIPSRTILVVNFRQSVIIAELWLPEVARRKIFEKFLRFWEKRPLTVKVSKICLKVFIATPIDVLCSNFVKFGRREIGEIVILFT